MTEKSKKPRLRFKGFTETWEQRKFEYWFTERNERSGEGELISVTINSGIKKFNELNRFDSKPEDMSKYKVVMIGDIAYNSMRMWQGASGLSPYNGILSPAYTVISPKSNADSKFFAFLIKKPELIHLFEINSQGLTKDTWNLKFPAFSQIEAAAPVDLDEQSKIATLLEQLDNLITLHQCKDLQFFIPKKYKMLFGFCNQKTTTWEQCELGKIGSTYTGLSGKSKADFGHGKGKFITYMNVFTNPIANLGTVEPIEIDDKQNKVLAGDVFFTTSSETPDEVGMSCVLTENSPNTYLNSFCFGYRPTMKFDNYYLAYMLRSASFRAKITFLAQGISRYNISKNKVMEIEIPIPEINEQLKIGAYFRNIDNLITLHQRVLINFKEHFYDKRNEQKRITYRLF